MKNEVLQLYDEALREAKEETDVLLVQIIRRKLEERIGRDRNEYLLYKAKYSVKDSAISIEGILSIVIAIVALVLSVLSITGDFIGNNKAFAVVTALGALGILACIMMAVKIYIYLRNFFKYRLVSYVLEEMESEL